MKKMNEKIFNMTERHIGGDDVYADIITKMFDKLAGFDRGQKTGNHKLNNINPGDNKMKTIEFEFDSEKDIKVEGKKLIVTHKHFPIKIKASTRNGNEVKRVVSLKFKCGVPRILLS